MPISEEQITRFQELYQEKAGEPISREDALKHINKIFKQFDQVIDAAASKRWKDGRQKAN